MAIKLIANYSKRLGLPGYSSHQFSVSIETELVGIDDIAGEAARLYRDLQSNVDAQMQQTGFVPPTDYGIEPATPNGNTPQAATQPIQRLHALPRDPAWRCSEKQRELILKLIEEHQLDKNQIEALAIERFGKGVRHLNKVEASGLIDELLDTHGNRNANSNGQASQNGNGRPSAYAGRRVAS